MMVPLFSNSQIRRLKRAHQAGIPTPELSERFGVREPMILDILRGKMPKVKSYDNPIEDGGLCREQSIQSCKKHLEDLIKVYRPEVYETYQKIKKQAQQKKVKKESESVAAPIDISQTLTENIYTFRRSRRIFQAGLRYFDVSEGEMIGDIRVHPLPFIRQKLMFVIYSECSKFETTPSIGRMFRRDHSTVVHAIQKIKRLIAAGDETTIADINALRGVK